jgi:predicted transcriptional regulator of viral defense system
MKYYEQLVDAGCFTLADVTALTGNVDTARSVLFSYQKNGLITKVRRNLYAAMSLETKQTIPNRYAIASHIAYDAYVTHHSAFEVHGVANQVYYRNQVRVPIIDDGARTAPFIENCCAVSDKKYYRNQVRVPIIDDGARTAPFIENCVAVSDKKYYRNQVRVPIIDDGARTAPFIENCCAVSDKKYYEIYVASVKRFESFEFNGVSYRRVTPGIKEGVISAGKNIRMTDIERTVLESIRDFEKIGGLEETLKCIALIPHLDADKLLEYLFAYGNGFLYQRTGYLLSQSEGLFSLPESFYATCQSHIPSAKRYLYGGLQAEPHKLDHEWLLFIPEILDKGDIYSDDV